jgi:hypothetical protein
VEAGAAVGAGLSAPLLDSTAVAAGAADPESVESAGAVELQAMTAIMETITEITTIRRTVAELNEINIIGPSCMQRF